MIGLENVSSGLVEMLQHLGEEYGPMGVAEVAAQLTDTHALVQRLIVYGLQIDESPYVMPKSGAYSPTDAQAALFAAVQSRGNATPDDVTRTADAYLSWLEAANG